MKFIYSFAFILGVVYGSSSRDSSTQLAKLPLKIDPACRKIKCPPISDPLCVRVKHIISPIKLKYVYMEVINRCEMKFIHCYEGVEAKEVPMFYCDHGKNITSDLEVLQAKKPQRRTSDIGKRRGKNKKQFKKKFNKLGMLKKTKASNIEINKKIRRKRNAEEQVNKEKELQHLIQAQNTLLSEKSVQNKNIKRKPKKYLGSSYNHMSKNKNGSKLYVERQGPDEDELENPKPYIYVIPPKGKKNKPTQLQAGKDDDESEGPPLTAEVEGDDPELAGVGELKLDQPGRPKPAQPGGLYVPAPKDDTYNLDAKLDPREMELMLDAVEDVGSGREEYKIDSEENIPGENVDEENNEADCPSVCPARAVMLCGRCKDGIYRTFLSVCHMRMFDCQHPDEKLSLVSRYPCAMSGPYLQDLKVPQGVLHEPHDDDVVLRYLKCKDYAKKKLKPWSKLNCDFEKKK